jgi:hypothetical protein
MQGLVHHMMSEGHARFERIFGLMLGKLQKSLKERKREKHCKTVSRK